MTCEFCGGEFTALRRSARFCSDRCRKGAWAARRPAEVVFLEAPAPAADGRGVPTVEERRARVDALKARIDEVVRRDYGDGRGGWASRR